MFKTREVAGATPTERNSLYISHEKLLKYSYKFEMYHTRTCRV